VPNLFVIAGPNGAGKSTVAPKLLTENRRVEAFVNADEIKADMGGKAGPSADILAGRMMLERVDQLVNLGRDLAFETTLASRSLLRRVSATREIGYLFHLIYLWLPTPEMAVERVAARVRAGGHSIPETVVRRRYGRSLSNFSISIGQLRIPGSCSTIQERPNRCRLLGVTSAGRSKS